MSRFTYSSMPDCSASNIVVSHNLKKFAIMSYRDAVELMLGHIPVQQSYHECIRSSVRQKPRFDIDDHECTMDDMSIDPAHLVDCLLVSISYVLDKYYNAYLDPAHDIMVFNSSGQTSKGMRYSYHIIIRHFFVQSSDHMIQLYDLCIEHLYEMLSADMVSVCKEHKYMDGSIYKGDKRQFRMYNTYSSTRQKKYMKSIIYQGNVVDCKKSFIDEFGEHARDTIAIQSMVTYIDKSCGILECSMPLKQNDVYSSNVQIVDMNVSRVYNMFKEKFGNVGVISKVDPKRNKIDIKRTRPSFCIICKRKHTSDNYYIIYRSSSMARVYCYRQYSLENKSSYMLDMRDELTEQAEHVEDQAAESKDEAEHVEEVYTGSTVEEVYTGNTVEEYIAKTRKDIADTLLEKSKLKTRDAELRRRAGIDQVYASIVKRFNM